MVQATLLSNLPACTTTTTAAAAAVLPWSASFCAHSCAVQQSHASTLCDWLCVLNLVLSLASLFSSVLATQRGVCGVTTHVWEEVRRKAQECLCRTQHIVDGDGCDVWVWSFHAIQCLLAGAHSLECMDSLLSLSLVVPWLAFVSLLCDGVCHRAAVSHTNNVNTVQDTTTTR
jgi:hypothetical protein